MIILAAVFAFFGGILAALGWLAFGLAMDALARKHGPYSNDDWPYSEIYPSERLLALGRDGYRCRVCGGPGSITHHIVPRRQGGSDHHTNLLTVCARCHPVVEP